MIRSIQSTVDIEYVIEAHCRIYSSEFSYDSSFIDFITESITAFGRNRNEDKENLWIVDMEGQLKGCIAIMNYTKQ